MWIRSIRPDLVYSLPEAWEVSWESPVQRGFDWGDVTRQEMHHVSYAEACRILYLLLLDRRSR